ncbi:MAG: rhomboid family intramembrane serine protease [Ignavibacteria bacterium]|nr:rhomboid family intramembrane serine protease [Ignavibacteria bacterium]
MSNDYYRPGGFGGFSFFPPVIKNLLIINGAVFLVQMLSMSRFSGAYEIIIRTFGLMPIASGEFQVWQLVSYQFLHGNFSHVLFNMISLWMFGIEIENYWGSRKFLIFYLLCGVGGGLLQLLLPIVLGMPQAPTIGASGAIYGVMLAFALLYPDRYIYIYFFIPVKAKYMILGMMVLNILGIGDGGGVAYLAHIGGALTALIYLMANRDTNFSISNLFGIQRRNNSFGSSQRNYYSSFTRQEPDKSNDVEDARYYDINEKTTISQAEIDRILDKISKSGYANLTEEEKRILFEASKRMK